MSESTSVNVAVFIDYENVHINILEHSTNTLRQGFFEKMRMWAKNKNQRIVKMAVYCNFDNDDLYRSHHQSILQSYGVETIHTANQSKNYADLQITIDVLNCMYLNNNIDEFIIVSNDKDMTPLLNTIRLNKRKVTIVTLGDKYNNSISMFADEHVKYEDIISTSVDGLIVDKFKDIIWEKLYDYITVKKLDIQLKSKLIPDYGVTFFLRDTPKIYKIMSYELAYFLKQYYLDKKIVFYKYTRNGIVFDGFMPTDYMQKFISNGIMTESDFYECYDCDKTIADEYRNVCSKYKKEEI